MGLKPWRQSPNLSHCEGCQWHMPKEVGGQGFLCDQKRMVTEGKCPQWAIRWYLDTTQSSDLSGMRAHNQI